MFLVVGNSGSGKDSIISGVIKKYSSNFKKIHRSKRYITRSASEFEDNLSINGKEFKEMKKQGKFALNWEIYGLQYGVPIEIDEWLENGHDVIVNASRTIINEARALYENLKVVFIEVPLKITIERIKSRGREFGKSLEERIQRAKNNQKLVNADFVVNNSGKLEDAIDEFIAYLLEFQH